MRIFETRGFMPGEFGADRSHRQIQLPDGQRADRGRVASIVEKTGDMDFLYNGVKLNNHVKATRWVAASGSAWRSQRVIPVYARYQPHCYPNWAAKFLADSLILEECILKSGQSYDEHD